MLTLLNPKNIAQSYFSGWFQSSNAKSLPSSYSFSDFRNYILILNKQVTPLLTPHTLGIAAIGVGAIALARFIKYRPERPIAKLHTSLNQGIFSVHYPKKNRTPEPVNATVTLCIDISGSMSNTVPNSNLSYIKTVSQGLHIFLDTIQTTIKESPKSKIAISAIAFDDVPKKILEPTLITSTSNMNELKKTFSLEGTGRTRINPALQESAKLVNEMTKLQKNANHYLVLLTDGQERADKSSLEEVYNTLKRVNKVAQERFIVVGIGQGHKETLQDIAQFKAILPSQEKEGRLQRVFLWFQSIHPFKFLEKKLPIGKYIQTNEKPKSDEVTIGNAISQIAMRITSSRSFTNLQIQFPQLTKEQWSIDPAVDGRLPENGTHEYSIKIDPATFSKKFDLNKLKCLLTFQDPQGKLGTMQFRWTQGSVIDPTVTKSLAKKNQ